MAPEILNDNVDPGRNVLPPDPHGQAAILLVESLIHGLIERQVISVADAVDILDTAADVGRELAVAGTNSAPPPQAPSILEAMRSSLARDLSRPGGPASPQAGETDGA